MIRTLRRLPAALFALALALGVQAAQRFEVKIIEPEGFRFLSSEALAINDRGDVVLTTGDAVRPYKDRFWLRDAEGGFVEITPPPDAAYIAVAAMNDSREVTGYWAKSVLSGVYAGFVWSPGRGWVDLEIPPGALSVYPADINEAGAVVGSVRDKATGQNRSFRWTAASGLHIYLPDRHTAAAAINDAGDILATDLGRKPRSPRSSCLEAVLVVSPRKFQRLGGLRPSPGCSKSAGVALNNDGSALVAWFETGGYVGPAIWTEQDGLVDLDIPGAEPIDFNSRHQVIGYQPPFDLSVYKGFYWSHDNGVSWLDEAQAQAGPSFVLLRASAINSMGIMVGDGALNRDGPRRAVLFSPAP
jgi:hypothetical protein